MNVRPPITDTTHILPYDRLSPAEFERFCLWLVLREGYEDAEHIGTAGEDTGRDILVTRNGESWAIQWKRVKASSPADAIKEVDKLLSLPPDARPDGLVFLTTCDVSGETRFRARARNHGSFECEFWALSELDERTKKHADLIAEFFQLSMATTESPKSTHAANEYREDFTSDFLTLLDSFQMPYDVVEKTSDSVDVVIIDVRGLFPTKILISATSQELDQRTVRSAADRLQTIRDTTHSFLVSEKAPDSKVEAFAERLGIEVRSLPEFRELLLRATPHDNFIFGRIATASLLTGGNR